MKIFSATQFYEADSITLKKQGIASAELMERAGNEISNWLTTRYKSAETNICIFCGVGNNGGDGLVTARKLIQAGYTVRVYVVCFSERRSGDFSLNLERLHSILCFPQEITVSSALPAIQKDELIIDAIFGIGLQRPPQLWVANLLRHINSSGASVVSVDVPSGLSLHASPEDKTAVIQATVTLTLQLPKLLFFLPETGGYAGRWEVLSIGLDEDYIKETPALAQLIDKGIVRERYRPRKKFSHKGTYGHGLLVGGSYGKIGAVALAAKACITAGAGLVSAYIPKCGYEILQTTVPEVMVFTDGAENHLANILLSWQPTAIGVGMGMGTEPETLWAFSRFIQGVTAPTVIDADGLNLLAQNSGLLNHLPEKTILTPHPKELERLIGTWGDDFEKLEKVQAFARKYGVVMVVKGAHTLVADGTNLYVNSTGNPGMATAGSGDALTGIITGWLAQGYAPIDAAILGVYVHGRAGDLAFEKIGYEALTASALIANMGAACVTTFGENK